MGVRIHSLCSNVILEYYEQKFERYVIKINTNTMPERVILKKCIIDILCKSGNQLMQMVIEIVL